MQLSARSNRSALVAAGSLAQQPHSARAHYAPGTSTRATNPLLVRDAVGRARPSCYDLPSEHFAYGRPGLPDAEGAREVASTWAKHRASPAPEEPVSFQRFHTKASAAHVVTAKDEAKFRKELGDVKQRPRAKSGTPRLRTKEDLLPRDLPQDFIFGRKVRPSTPVAEVVSYHFAREAEHELDTFYDDFRATKDTAMAQVRKITMTVAARGHATAKQAITQETAQAKEQFKLSKFRKVPHKVDTRRRIPALGTLADACASDLADLDVDNLDPEALVAACGY